GWPSRRMAARPPPWRWRRGAPRRASIARRCRRRGWRRLRSFRSRPETPCASRGRPSRAGAWWCAADRRRRFASRASRPKRRRRSASGSRLRGHSRRLRAPRSQLLLRSSAQQPWRARLRRRPRDARLRSPAPHRASRIADPPGRKRPGRDVPKNVAASARKITGMLSVGERASIQRAGQDSHFIDALAARIVLDAAAAEGTRLASAGAAPVVDADSLAVLTKIADEAAGRLQKEANSAIGRGEVESLQLIPAASASLSRDLLNLKETADRL